MSVQDDKTRSCIEQELLRELAGCDSILLDTLNKELSSLEFHAMKYKDEECYKKLISFKRAHNILKLYLDIAKKHNLN